MPVALKLLSCIASFHTRYGRDFRPLGLNQVQQLEAVLSSALTVRSLSEAGSDRGRRRIDGNIL